MRAASLVQMNDPRHAPILMSGLDAPFTEQSTRFLSPRLFGHATALFTLAAARVEGDRRVGYALCGELQPCTTFGTLERFGYVWQADPKILTILRSRLLDVDHGECSLVLGSRLDTALCQCAAR